MAPAWMKPYLLAIWRRFPGWLQGAIERLILPKWLVGAIAVVVDDQSRVLLFHHTYRDDYPWGFPGGWVKRGEDPNRGVEREVFEEAGYHVRTRHPLVIGGDRRLGRLDLIFLCDLVGPDDAFRPSAEVSDARFFTLDELPGRVEPFHVQVAAYAVEVASSGALLPSPQKSD